MNVRERSESPAPATALVCRVANLENLKAARPWCWLRRETHPTSFRLLARDRHARNLPVSRLARNV